MLLEKGVLTGRKNRIIVGYDLGDKNSQISFCRMDQGEPESASVVAGGEQYDFPTVLCKRKEVNQWVYGKEAQRLAEADRGILVENLLTLARRGEEVNVGGEFFDPVALLALFLKRSLSLLGITAAAEQVGVLMITVETLDVRTAEVLTQAACRMQMPSASVFFQSYTESFYHYMLHQPRELWQAQVLLCDLEADRLLTCRMECSRRTVPMTAFVEDRLYPGWERGDAAFLEILKSYCGETVVSSVYLIGSGFEEEWYHDSLYYLCRGRRVFRGNNLYSKGACYGGRERCLPDQDAERYVLLGRDKLKANIGMKVLRRGQDSYFALLDAGTSWFEAEKKCEFLLESGNSFSLLITPLHGKDAKCVESVLHGLPKRGERATKLGMSVSMKSEETVLVEVRDLGFGEIYPASDNVWQEEFAI